jgi:hypothetical protein
MTLLLSFIESNATVERKATGSATMTLSGSFSLPIDDEISEEEIDEHVSNSLYYVDDFDDEPYREECVIDHVGIVHLITMNAFETISRRS